MPTFEFRPPVRENLPLLLGVVGGTGSGKTNSSLLLARGLAGGEPFAAIDTENGRMLHYADLFPEMRHSRLTAPYRPERYAEAIADAAAASFKVVVVDSMSHEWAGDGGVLDWQTDEYKRLGGREAIKLLSWSEPKQGHKRMVSRLLQANCHVILCFRASRQVEMVRNGNRTEVVPKASLNGLDGWLPITSDDLPYELTASFLLMADKPGVPRPIKLNEQHKALVPLDRPLDAKVGEAFGAWAAGGAKPSTEPQPTVAGIAPAPTASDQREQTPLELAGQAHPPIGVNGITDAQAGYTLEGILETGERGVEFLRWASAQDGWPDEFRDNLDVFVQAKLGTAAAA